MRVSAQKLRGEACLSHKAHRGAFCLEKQAAFLHPQQEIGRWGRGERHTETEVGRERQTEGERQTDREKVNKRETEDRKRGRERGRSYRASSSC